MGGYAAAFILILWAIIALLSGPSNAEVQSACKGHGRVVDYTPGAYWSFNSEALVVCSDGNVRNIK